MLTSLLNSSVGEPKTNFQPEVMESGTGKFGGSMFCHLVLKNPQKKYDPNCWGVVFCPSTAGKKGLFWGKTPGKLDV